MVRIALFFSAILWSYPAYAAVGAVGVQTTPTQAVLSFHVNDPTQCLVQVYSDSARTQLVDDTNSTLFAGSQRCNRAGSAVIGSNVSFVAGLRAAQKASDGVMHSRALAALTTYYYTITDLVQFQTAQGSFTTRNPSIGNMYPEQPPFDANGWDNRAYPQFHWTSGDRNQMLVDPTSGLLVKRMTFAGDAYVKSQYSGDGTGALFPAAVTGTSNCTNASNLSAAGSSYGLCTGAAKMFLPLPAFQMVGTGTFNNWYPRFNTDDLILYAYGSADSAAIGSNDGSNKLTVCLAQGLNLPCLSNQFTVTLQSSASATGTAKVPANTPAPVFANWGYTPLHGDVVPTPGMVSVSGNTVSLTNPGQSTTYQSEFDIEWPPGSQIYIQGSSAWGCVNSYCTIQSIQSATQLTTVESCLSNCPASASYEGRAFGFQVVRQGSNGSINVSFGFEADMSQSWAVQEDGMTQHCNQNPVTVTSDAFGNPYPGYTLLGYNCAFEGSWGALAHWLLISKDQYGNPLGEMRPLGQEGKPYTLSWNSNGASFPNGVNMTFAGWDQTDGSKFETTASYNNGATLLLLSAQYDATKPGCSPAYKNWTGAQQYIGAYAFPVDTCFTYTNLTNPTASPPMDLRSQIERAYATANPGFDLSGFGIGAAVVTGGYARVCLGATAVSDRTLLVCGTFDATTGNLAQVFDSFSKYPGRWGYGHGPVHALGIYHSLVLDQPDPVPSPTATLYGPFEMAVTAVNRAGFGQAPIWTTPGGTPGTSIAANEAYACPTGLAGYLVAAGAQGNHCIEVKVSSEPCSHNPGTAAIYPGGKTEAQQFPCTNTEGTVLTNASWSKLQNMLPGDWLRENEMYNYYGEKFIIAMKTVVSTTEIDLWLIRGSGVWPNNAQPPYATSVASHADGFSLAMAPSGSFGAAFWDMNATDPTAAWTVDNPSWALTHGTQAVGSTPNNKIAVAADPQNQNYYAGFYDLPMSQQIMRPLPDVAAISPPWANSTAGYNGFIQTYMNNDQTVASAWERKWVVNYRHLNPSAGDGAEWRTAIANTNLTLMPGTNQVYKITDSVSGGAPDPKNLPFILFAGRFLLKDISSPATGNTISDTTNFSACYALRAGECRTGSSAGDHYVSVPFAAGQNQCLSNQYEEVAPCFFNATPTAGKIQQMDISGRLDKNGIRQRMLPTAFTGIGGQYQYSEPKMSPDGAWMLVPCWWLNGVRSDVCGIHMPPFPASDSANRTTFLPHDVNVSGSSGDQVRICWGYAENGPVDGSANSLYPTTRQERGCSIGEASTTPAKNSASFIKTDTSTQGNWESTYGSDGYNVVYDSQQYPSYVNVTVGSGTPFAWTVQTTDVRALQRVSTSGRIASCFYNSVSETFDLQFTDGAVHTVAFYFLDWDLQNRAQTMQMLDGDTGVLLDSRTLSNFSNGVYLVWHLSGHVKVNVINQGPQNAVVNGIFFGDSGYGMGGSTGPFGWASEPASYANCSGSCRIRMNLIPDRVAYYVIERNRNGQVTTSPVMVAVP